jgi:hypothetical protein|tara:strand:+ start:1687 stop:1869 length:183 start_codon:yes stop_codon:yes gene_type:complete
MEPMFLIIHPGLTYLKKFQIVTLSYLNKAKKDFDFNPKFSSTDETNQPFTYTDGAEYFLK